MPRPPAGQALPAQSAYRQRPRAEWFAQERADHDNAQTPYGALYKTMELDGGDQAPAIRIDYACPFALLWWLCTLSVHFYRFFERYLARLSQPSDGQPDPLTRMRGRVALYWDEVVPGNNLRPDKGRAYIAVYWTFIDLPMWFINSAIGWFSLCYVPVRTEENIRGGVPLLNEAFLRVFWPEVEGLNFANGVRLIEGQAPPADPLGFQSRSFTFAADFAFFLADEAAFKKLSGAKGASGSKPCLCCQNVLGRCQPHEIPADGAPRLVHFSTPDVDTFAPHTPETLAQVWGHLAGQALLVNRRELSKAAFNLLQQSAGLKFSIVSLLHPRIREIANLPHSIYWDWMHCLVASGGVAQHELNQLLRRIADERDERGKRVMPLDMVQNFAKYVVFPKEGGFAPKLILADRLRDKPNKHIKAFAGEVLGWSVVLGLFCDMILVPAGRLRAEVECFTLLGRIIYLLRLGNGCVARLRLLRTLLHEHHVRYIALYPEAVTPKVHWLRHIPDCIERWGVLFACFATERKHRASKRIAAFAFKAWCSTLLRRTTRMHMEKALLPSSFQPEHLEPPAGKPVPAKFQSLLASAGILGQAQLARMAARAHLSVGNVARGDLLGVMVAGELRAGFAAQFFAVTGAAGEEFFALVQKLRPLGGNRFSRAAGHTEQGFMPLQAVLHAFPYFVMGTEVCVVAGIDEFT